MAKYFWPLFIFFVFLTLLPNYCFASINLGLKIQEVKTRGLNIASTATKWLEITNTSNNPINLSNICLAAGPSKISTTTPKNCFTNIDLNPYQILIVAYSGDAFLADNNLTLSGINGLLFELGGYGTSYADNPLIPNLLSPYKTSFLNNENAEIDLFDKITGEIIDSVSWINDQDVENSLQRPVYDSDFDFALAKPTPFTLLPEAIIITVANLKTDEATFDIGRINDPNKNISEIASLWQGGNLIEQKDISQQDIINFKNLNPATDYDLKIQACEITTNICAGTEFNFQTKQNYLGILINELYPAPNTSAGESEWLELYNPNSTSLDLSGWQVLDQSGHKFDLSGTITALGYLVFYPGSKLSLNNAGDTLNLYDPNGDLRNQVIYDDAKDKFSYANFSNGWQWTRTATLNKGNIFTPEYLPTSINNAQKLSEKVQFSGNIVVAPNTFGAYFYLNDGSWAIKIDPDSRIYPANQCLLVLGKIKQGTEPYLNLDSYKNLTNCNIMAPSFIKPEGDLKNFIGRLIKISGAVYTESGSYYLNFNNQKIKIRSLFKLFKGTGTIYGILGFGTKYFQIFVPIKEWFEIMPIVNSPPEKIINFDEVDDSNIVLAKTTKVKAASITPLIDYREQTQESNKIDFAFLVFYYLALISFSILAKMLIFS